MADNNFLTLAAAAAGAAVGAYCLFNGFSKNDKIRLISNSADCRRSLNEIWK